MNCQESPTEKKDGKVLLHKRFQVLIEYESEYRETEIHPDDKKAITLLRGKLLSDDEAITKLLLFATLFHIADDLPQHLAMIGVYDSSVSKLVESKARLLPRKLLKHLLDLELAGLGFAEEIGLAAVCSQVSKIQFFDMDHAKELSAEPEPEPLFYKNEYRKCLLAKTESEWFAQLQVNQNFPDENGDREAVITALRHIDQIHENVSGSDLPLREISIGIIAPSEAENEAARARIEAYASSKLPGTKIEMWYRQEKRMMSLKAIRSMMMSRSRGSE